MGSSRHGRPSQTGCCGTPFGNKRLDWFSPVDVVDFWQGSAVQMSLGFADVPIALMIGSNCISREPGRSTLARKKSPILPERTKPNYQVEYRALGNALGTEAEHMSDVLTNCHFLQRSQAKVCPCGYITAARRKLPY